MQLQQKAIKVINGIEVDYKKYPYFGVLWINGLPGCGASLIRRRTRNIVITAAHCVYQKRASSLKVGFYQPNRTTKKYTYNVRKVIIHPEYNDNTYENDIALLFISATPPAVVIPLRIPLHLFSFKTPILQSKKIRKNVKSIVGISPTMV